MRGSISLAAFMNSFALSISCAMTVNFLFLFTILYNKLNGFSLSYILKSLVKVILSTSLMVGWLFWTESFMEGGGIIRRFVEISGQIFTGAFVYGVALYFMKFPELEMIVESFKNKLK